MRLSEMGNKHVKCNDSVLSFAGTILSSLGLAKYFDFILASYEVKCAKPNPRYITEIH